MLAPALAVLVLVVPVDLAQESSPSTPAVASEGAVPGAAALEGVSATLAATPREVEVGEPMVWTLDVLHPAGVTPRLPDDDLGLGDRYVVLEASGELTSRVDGAGGASGAAALRTRKSWTVIALGPTKVLPSMEIFFGDEDGGPSILTAEGELQVRSLIGGDDEARPAKGFREPSTAADIEPIVPWWAAAAAATVTLGVVALLVRGRRRRATATPALPPLERLAELEQSVATDLPALQALHYSLTALLRDTLDQELGARRAPLTDEEWLAAVQADGRLAPAVREALGEVIGRAAEVKYARHKPTKFAVDETLRAARGALEATAGANGRTESARAARPGGSERVDGGVA
jgi:hypothetical protein